MTHDLKKIVPKMINKEQVKDSGLALILILLLTGFFSKDEIFFKIAIPILLLNMIVPKIFYPFAIVWLGFSHLMGTIMSKFILTFLYIVLVVPIGMVRKLLGKDTLQLKKFKQGQGSVLLDRKFLFGPADIEKPY